MKTVRTGSILAALCVAVPLWGQVATKPAEAAPADKELRQTQEDVAVFRLLLNRSLARAYGLPANAPGAGHPHGHMTPLAEGVYLKGVGVVYTAAAPPTRGDPLKKPDATSTEPSAWEKARIELRGEKPTAEPKTGETREVSLSETLLRLLADNGTHFGQLAADERVTIAVTFHSTHDCAKCHAANTRTGAWVPTRLAPVGEMMRSPMSTSAPVTGGQFSPSVPTTLKAPLYGDTLQTAPQTPDKYGDAQNDVILGDLNYKQGKYQEAERAYTRALQKIQEQKDPKQGATRLRQLLQCSELCSKLAQTLVALGDNDKARHFIEVAGRTAAEAAKLTGKESATTGVVVPNQLIISATKRQLDQAAGGKLSLEEFRKAAQIEYRSAEPKREKE